MKNDTTSAKTMFRSDAIQRIMAFSALIVLAVGFSLASPYFRTFDNFVGILLSTAVNGVLGLGVTFIIITGGIDLSVGTVLTFSAVMTGVFITNWHLPIPIGILGGVLAGSLAGLINGVLISRMRIPPFIATLGMLYATKGLSLVISELKPNQYLSYNRITKEKHIIDEDVYKYFAWKDGKLIFRDEPLDKVLSKLSLMFNVDIDLQGEELIPYRYHATFQDESLEEILKLLKLSAPLSFREIKRDPLPDGSFPKKKVIVFPVKSTKPN